MKTSEIFLPEPIQWGFRGDPYLWREIAKQLESTDMPMTVNELEKLIKDAYQLATGHVMQIEEFFIVERFRHGGMSSGGVSPQFWVEKALPLLLSRHAKP